MRKIFLFTVFVCTACTSNTGKDLNKRIIHTENAPAAVGVYSQAIETGNILFLSGQIGLIPGTRNLAGDNLESQTNQTLQNIEAVLKEAGYTLTDVVQVQVFLDDLENYNAFNEIYINYFPENPPARAVVEVSRIPLDAKVEIMVIASRN